MLEPPGGMNRCLPSPRPNPISHLGLSISGVQAEGDQGELILVETEESVRRGPSDQSTSHRHSSNKMSAGIVFPQISVVLLRDGPLSQTARPKKSRRELFAKR